jgi:hypothetical protein
VSPRFASAAKYLLGLVEWADSRGVANDGRNG